MPGQRRTGGSPSRGYWLPKLAGIGAIVVLVGGGATAYIVAFNPAKPRHIAPLPTKVLGYQTVGLIGEPASTGGSNQLVQLVSQAKGPVFAPVQPTQVASGAPEWTADQMEGGTYIFIYLPTGRCLTSAGPAGRTVLAVDHCNLGSAQQRWRLRNRVVRGGHDFYQFENAATGMCLAQVSRSASAPGGAGLAACDPNRPASQLLAFWWSIASS
jgi:hypothetical protein